MKKSMDIMAYKYLDVSKRYFTTYRKNINRIKTDQMYKFTGIFFESINQIATTNFKNLYINEA